MADMGNMLYLDFDDLGIGFIKGGGVYGAEGTPAGVMALLDQTETWGFIRGGGVYDSGFAPMGNLKEFVQEDNYGFADFHRPWVGGGALVNSGPMRQLTLSGKAPTIGDTIIELTYDVINVFFSVVAVKLIANFTDESSGGVIISWIWDFGDGESSTLQNPTHIYSSSGIYVVYLTASNGFSSGVYYRIVIIIDGHFINKILFSRDQSKLLLASDETFSNGVFGMRLDGGKVKSSSGLIKMYNGLGSL